MSPKKAKELIKPTASELGFSEVLVKDATDFFWEELRRTLSELRAPNVYVPGMGTFRASGKKLVKIRETYKATLEYNDPTTFNGYAKRKNIEGKLENIEHVFSMMRDSIEKKKKVKESRNGKDNLDRSTEEL